MSSSFMLIKEAPNTFNYMQKYFTFEFYSVAFSLLRSNKITGTGIN